MKIAHKGDKVTFEGSPATFVQGDNSEALDWLRMRTALEAISDEVGLDFLKAYLWFTEFAGTLGVMDPPVSYRPILHLPRKGRRELGESLYLQNKSRTFVFDSYDKSADGEYRIRLEVRRSQLAAFLGIDHHLRGEAVRVEKLCEEEVYIRFAQDWESQVATALAQCRAIPTVPATLSTMSLSKLESDLCRRHPETFAALVRIVECHDDAGTINKNLRARLLRELHSPQSENENQKVTELRSKCIMLLEQRGIELPGFRESKPMILSS